MGRSPDPPLRGRRVLVTRPRDLGEDLARRISDLGARVDLRPTIALQPPTDPAPVREALGRLSAYRWIVFTSPNGVRFFLGALGDASRPAAAVACMGPGTARELKGAGLVPRLVARESRAEGLARELAPLLAEEERVLLVRPEVARPVLERELRAAGARVEPVVFYRNVPAPGLAAIAADVASGCYDAVVFTSPSTVQRLLDSAGKTKNEAVREALRAGTIVVIGTVTAEAVRRLGLQEPVVAAEPSDEALVAALRDALEP